MTPLDMIMVQEIHKIVAHTLMMKPKAILTTEMRYVVIDDISRGNDLFPLVVDSGDRLAAGVWTAPSANSILQAQLSCLTYVFRRLSESCPEWEFWLIAGHNTMQPDNRITRHNGLWKSLRKAGVVIPEGIFIEEATFKSDSGFRALGAVRFDFGQTKAVLAVMKEAQAAVAFLPSPQAMSTISTLVRQGWELENVKPPKEILKVVSAQSGIVLDIYGSFDDPEVSVAAIGNKNVLLNLDLAS